MSFSSRSGPSSEFSVGERCEGPGNTADVDAWNEKRSSLNQSFGGALGGDVEAVECG